MGKSPGKWIKNFFGKKPSKSIVEKRRASSSGNKDGNTGKEPLSATDTGANNDRTPNLNVNGTNPKLQTNTPDGKPNLSKQVDSKDQGSAPVSSPIYSEEERAAITAQSAFRGHLARKAFYALKGIIRLQALVRGHLTRRQALATLHCTWGIVKLQSLVRGTISRKNTSFKTNAISNRTKVGLGDKSWASGNAFARKLVCSSLSRKALGVQYSREEPNSPWEWLERWTVSEFWKPTWQAKKPTDPRPRGRRYAMETESGRTKRVIRTTNGADSALTNPRKPPNHTPEIPLENPHSELERVKRNLRKVTGKPIPELPPPTRPDTESEKNPKPVSPEPDPFTVDRKAEIFEEEKPNKAADRRASFSSPREIDLPEIISQHTPKLPSYMAATQSAKAKLRGHTSPRLGSDEADHASFTRRHSLPTSVNGKFGSASPRAHRPGAKAGPRTDRSLISSRDGKDKPVLVEWRR
ncbi:protein IQ-DOMAIN 29-like [Wolffia australiana]